ncbi:hypothetical protein C8R44DRAFT_892594 [Mycena epipterygia]|nr:hypothetical protein C8R44DRAFT_892594 [Mycena epipterygia]
MLVPAPSTPRPPSFALAAPRLAPPPSYDLVACPPPLAQPPLHSWHLPHPYYMMCVIRDVTHDIVDDTALHPQVPFSLFPPDPPSASLALSLALRPRLPSPRPYQLLHPLSPCPRRRHPRPPASAHREFTPPPLGLSKAPPQQPEDLHVQVLQLLSPLLPPCPSPTPYIKLPLPQLARLILAYTTSLYSWVAILDRLPLECTCFPQTSPPALTCAQYSVAFPHCGTARYAEAEDVFVPKVSAPCINEDVHPTQTQTQARTASCLP